MTYRSDSPDRYFMRAAIEQQKLCSGTPKVGAVIVSNGVVVAKGYRHEGKVDSISGKHAEAVAIDKLVNTDIDRSACVLYVTLEPCNETAKDCAQAIINAGIREVVIGSYDLNPDVNRLGWRKLKNNEVNLRDFDSDLIAESRRENPVEHFHKKIGPKGHGKFAYRQNGNKGTFDLKMSASNQKIISFRCSSRGENSVYVYAKHGSNSAEARFAKEYSEIDNPDAYQFDQSAEAAIGDIVIVRSEYGYALVKIMQVDIDNSTMNFEFEIRSIN